ncbi:hypothetical protein BH780_gp229 [Bacillus phage Eldridge]|uniref:Uncharacterized protein n=1 Tax=Bacillus phage Eldridge TaxID=1776293 RepID=A0A0Y0AVE4_9CAUD|nr:hypothetical protein BH780_gp229 [Bacillus phage Eldridge]AMB18812.1 hypothetical protein Eldridge_0232 [Bacillus phage Eldridge]
MTNVNTNSIQNTINEVMETRGATVSIFGQPTTLDQEIGKGYVDIIDILESFKGYEADTNIPAQYEVLEDIEETFRIIDQDGNVIESDFEDEAEAEERMYELQEENETPATATEFLDYLDELGYVKEVNSGNSYNWSGRVSNHFNYNIYESTINNTFYVEFKVHLYGDVRANYTEPVVLKFDNEYDFLDMMADSDTIEEYKGYTARISALHEGIEIDNEDGEIMETQYDWDDVIEYIDGLEAEKEEGEE